MYFVWIYGFSWIMVVLYHFYDMNYVMVYVYVDVLWYYLLVEYV